LPDPEINEDVMGILYILHDKKFFYLATIAIA